MPHILEMHSKNKQRSVCENECKHEAGPWSAKGCPAAEQDCTGGQIVGEAPACPMVLVALHEFVVE